MNSNFNYEEEKKKLDKEKLEWEKIKREQESRLQMESNILMSLQESLLNYTLNHQQKNFNNENNISELESLKLLYENKIKDLITQINLIEEETKLFNDYKNNSNKLLNEQIEQLKQKELEKGQKKSEILEQMAEIESKEKKIIEEMSIYEKDKKVLTELYNEVIKKQNENTMRAKDIDDMVRELDKRKNEMEEKKREFTNKVNEIKNEKIKVDKEKKYLENEKNNLLLKLESIDIVGMKLIDGSNNEEREKNWETQKEKFYYETFSGNYMNPLNNSKTGIKNEKNKTNFFN
jgi:hypothetical protein